MKRIVPSHLLFITIAMMLLPDFVWAHVESGRAGGFVAGFGHPISGWDHIVAMIAVGFWGAQLGMPAIWLLPVTFPMMMALGGMLGLMGVPIPAVEIGIAGSAVVLGLLVALEARLPLAVCMGIVGIFALFHGHAHGTELAPGADALSFSLGFVVSTGCLHAVGILIGLLHRRPTGKPIIRALGAVVCAAGLYFFWQAFA